MKKPDTEPKRKIGRPTKKTPELVDEIIERLIEGQSMAQICKLEHMPSYVNVWRWEQDDEEFRNRSAHAKVEGTHFLAGDSLRIADDQTIDPQHKRVMVDTRLRLIGKWNRKIYGEKVTNEHSGPDGGPIEHQYSALTDEQLAAEIAKRAAALVP